MAQLSSGTARVGGVAVQSLGKRLVDAKAGWIVTAITVGALAAGLIPWGGGSAIGLAMDRYRNHIIADRQKEVLADHYKAQVAATLGINSSSVSLSDLDMAARVNPMVQSAIDKVNQERDDANRSALMANGASGALSMATGMGFVPGLSVIPHLAAHAAVSVAGMGVSSLFDKDVLHVHDVMEHLDSKQKSGEVITANDVLMLRIAQSQELQDFIKKSSDTAFHKMNDAQQQAVIASLPSGMYAEAAEAASRLASGQIKDTQGLLMPAVANENTAPNNWADRVGGSRQATASFVDRVGAHKDKPASFVEGVEARAANANMSATTAI